MLRCCGRPGANLRQTGSSSRLPANSCSIPPQLAARVVAGRPSARPVHFAQRALDHAVGQVMQLDLAPRLQELEVHRPRGRPAGARRRLRVTQHLPRQASGSSGCISHSGCPNQSRIAAGGWCHCGSCCRPAPPRHAPAQTRPARRSRSQRGPPRSPVSVLIAAGARLVN